MGSRKRGVELERVLSLDRIVGSWCYLLPIKETYMADRSHEDDHGEDVRRPIP